MDRLALLNGGETQDLLVGARNEENGGAIVTRSVTARQLLTAVRATREHIEVVETVLGRPELLRDNPFLTDDEAAFLDDRGLIREGSTVRGGTVLASLVEPQAHDEKRAPAGKKWVADMSRRVEPHWSGAVVVSVAYQSTEGRRRDARKGLLAEIDIQLRREEPLQVGDILLIDSQEVVVSRIVADEELEGPDGPIQISVDAGVGRALGLEPTAAEPVSVARSIHTSNSVQLVRRTGPRSLISRRPLYRPPTRPAVVSREHLAWLAERGCNALVGEFSTLRSDCPVSIAAEIARSFKTGEPGTLDLPSDYQNESMLIVAAELTSLGLKVDIDSVDDRTRLRLGPSTAEEILANSNGEIRKPETLNYRTFKSEPGGLFCPEVFGAEDQSRREVFGHVSLAAPIVPWLWRVGEPSVLQLATGLDTKQLDEIVGFETQVFQRGGEFRFAENAEAGEFDESWELIAGGAAAIEKMVDASRLPPSFEGRAETITMRQLPMLPPDLRPIVLLDSGNFATSDLNDHYRRVINRNNRLRKLIDLGAPEVIVRNETRMLQLTVDQLMANCFVSGSKVMGSQNRPLKCIISMIVGRNESQKTLQWCARSRLIEDAAMPLDCVGVPEEIYNGLSLSADIPVLLTSPQSDYEVAARKPVCGGEAIRLHPATRAALGVDADTIADCLLHRVMTHAGADEAKRLLRDEAPPTREVPIASGWIDASTEQKLLVELLEMVKSGDTVTLESSRGLILGGVGARPAPTPAADTRPAAADSGLKLIDDKPIEKREVTTEQLIDAVEARRTQSCRFRFEAADDVECGAGQVGGTPWLPRGFQWPKSEGDPLTFLAQFPLDPAREAGLLPFKIPAGQMLSVFWADDWWECGPVDRGPVFIHPVDDCVSTELPNGVEPIACQRLQVEFVEETPTWAQMKSMLEWEFDSPEHHVLREFADEMYAQFPEAEERTKIGGWPHWVQDDVGLTLVAQIASDDPLQFGDCGSLYILGDDPDDLTVMMQSY